MNPPKLPPFNPKAYFQPKSLQQIASRNFFKADTPDFYNVFATENANTPQQVMMFELLRKLPEKQLITLPIYTQGCYNYHSIIHTAMWRVLQTANASDLAAMMHNVIQTMNDPEVSARLKSELDSLYAKGCQIIRELFSKNPDPFARGLLFCFLIRESQNETGNPEINLYLKETMLTEISKCGLLNNIYLVGADLSHLNLSQLNLSEVTIVGSDLNHANLCDTNLTDAIIKNTSLIGANLSRAKLTGVNRSQQERLGVRYKAGGNHEYNAPLDLTDCNLCSAQINNSNLANSTMFNTQLNNTSLANANLSNARIKNSSLINANLKNATLDSTHVRNVDFSGANFTGADLTNSHLSQIKLQDTIGTQEELKSARRRNNCIIS